MKFRKVGILAMLFAIFSMIVMSIETYAEPVYIESLNITVNTKDIPTKAVVVDNRGVLSSEGISAIENAGLRLNVYNLGVYIETTDENICSQSYANNLAEKMFSLVPDENSILIAFSFYEDENGYYGVHYNVQGDLSEMRISGIISGTYHDFKTDASWIVGSTEQVVDYLVETEYNLLTTDARKAAEAKRTAEFLKVLRIILEVFAIIFIIFLIVVYWRKVNEFEEIIENKTEEIMAVKKELLNLMSEKKCVDKKLKELRTWKSRAIDVDTDIEKKIKTLLAKRTAEQFSKDYSEALNLDEYVSMFDRYNSMDDEEKSFVTLDMDKALETLDRLAKSEATKATKLIEETCNLSSTKGNYSEYNKTMEYYQGLPDCVRMLIAITLINNLSNNRDQAHKDYIRHQRSESSSSYNDSSYSSSSSFGGGFHSGTFGGGFGGGH